MFTREFWVEASQRAIRTFSQTFISVVGVSSFSVWSLDWKQTLGVSLGSALLALLMAIDRTSSVVQAATVVREIRSVEADSGHSYNESLR